MSSANKKALIRQNLEETMPVLWQLAKELHANPELGWEEHHSSARIAELLSKFNFSVEKPYLELPTAFHATSGTGMFKVGFLAEYDALPGLGHACGHNLISAISVGAAIALQAVAEQADITVAVIGTPAEEGYGGKIELLQRGAFKDLNLAMLAHPAPVDVAEAKPYAVSHWHIRYEGKAAHAAAYPEKGTNANDAFIIAQTAIALLRQQLPSGVRVHGVQTRGGEAPNAIPEVTEGRWYVRAETTKELLEIEQKVRNCFTAGALATGSKLTITPEGGRYSEMRTDHEALEIYIQNATALGRQFETDSAAAAMARASTDMGNVSQIVNAIHPYIGVGSTASNHQAEFAAACVTPKAMQALHDGALALAYTALDVATRRNPQQ